MIIFDKKEKHFSLIFKKWQFFNKFSIAIGLTP
jgi:hypothetical protein